MSPAHMPQLICITVLPVHTPDTHILPEWIQVDLGAFNSISYGKLHSMAQKHTPHPPEKLAYG